MDSGGNFSGWKFRGEFETAEVFRRVPKRPVFGTKVNNVVRRRDMEHTPGRDTTYGVPQIIPRGLGRECKRRERRSTTEGGNRKIF